VTERLLTAEQVADLIGMSPDYVYALSRRGQIPTLAEIERGSNVSPNTKRPGGALTPPARHRRV
jgi:hypothetical protein